MLRKLVRNQSPYISLRGRTYYFRFSVPLHIKRLCPELPAEYKRSLKTDSFSEALSLVSQKLPLIKLIRNCSDPKLLSNLFARLLDFSSELASLFASQLEHVREASVGSQQAVDPVPPVAQPKTPKLSVVWKRFARWKEWKPKVQESNQRMFETLLFFVGDKPVGEIGKSDLKKALGKIAKLPKRNVYRYKDKPLEELTQMRIPGDHRISSKMVKEHLKLCQSLFSRYLVKEVDVLERSPTENLKYEAESVRYASLSDSDVKALIRASKQKPEWFQWFLLLACYSGARRSELALLRGQDFKLCADTGRWYFLIEQGKTKAARRQVPLHQQLIELGLMDWVQGRASNQALFPVAQRNGNRVYEMFAALRAKKTNDLGERIVFHSLRHTFVTKARASGVSSVLVQQVVGHEKRGAGITDRYTHTFQLKNVLEVVDQIGFESG